MNSVVIVTGGGRGIGLAIAERCHSDGNTVIRIDRNFATSPDNRFTDIDGDVREWSLAELALSHSLVTGSKVSLVNAAGVTHPESGDFTLDAWGETISVNLTGVFIWCESFRRAVNAKRFTGRSIVNIASLAAHRGFLNNPSYAASKSGVLGVTRSFAIELGHLGITVNSISPGYIRTSMTERSWNDSDLRLGKANSSMLGRWGEPTDIANACHFLLSDSSRFITGIDLPVDGGWLSKG